MSNYRPITDVMILARAKLLNGQKYYGAYPSGFAERARHLLGASIKSPVLHVCGGKARFYPHRGGFGPNDKTLDLDGLLLPDYSQDARDPWPTPAPNGDIPRKWHHILVDPPYSEVEAEHYAPGPKAYPTPGRLLQRAAEVLAPGGRVGIIHYLWPRPPEGLKCIAVTGVLVGFNNRIRVFTVYEKQ